MHKEITELTKFGECLVSLVPRYSFLFIFLFFVPLAIEEHNDQNKQLYISSRYFGRFEKNWSVTLMQEQHMSRMFKNRVTKERHMSIGDFTKLHDEQPGDSVLLTGYQKGDQMERKNVARMGKTRRAYKLLVGKPEGNGALGRPRGGEIFRTCRDRPWGPPSLLYNGYRVFPGGKERPGRDADPSLLLVP